MSAADWYARHVGRQPAAPAQSPYYVPQAPQGYQAPPGYVLVPAAPQAAPQDLSAYGIGGGPADLWTEPPPPPVDTSRIPRGAVDAENFLKLANLWRGGEGKKQAQPCQRCGGVMFHRFERGMEARPLCTACGYNGAWSQGEYQHSGAM